MRMRLLLVGLAALPFALAACGGDSKDEGDPTPSANALTDEQYLAVFCTGVANYREALLNQPSAAGIANTIKTYVAELKKIEPPAGLGKWHKEYITYLEDAEKDPTSLVSTAAPLPPDADRARLVSKISSVPECKYPTFLGQG